MGAMQAVELEPDGGPATITEENQGWNARFASLSEEHSRFLFRIAYGLLRNAHDAEDAVQEALLRIYRSGCNHVKTGGTDIADEKAYLARTVWHTGLDIAARRPKLTEPLQGDGEQSAQRDFASAERSAEQELAEGDERALLRKLIDALPEDLRQPLVLSAIEEMTSREVAAALGIAEGTVRTRIMRARAELRRRFEAVRARPQSNTRTTFRRPQ